MRKSLATGYMKLPLLLFGALILLVQASSLAIARDLPPYLSEEEKNSITVFQDVNPSVVHVNTHKLYRNYFSMDVTKVRAGEGSGFIWDSAGHVITNYHVIQNSSSITVSLYNGKTVEAKVVGVEPRKDIAVLKLMKLEKADIRAVRVADSSKLIVGQKAIAIGNPFGLDHTLTVGIVSALGRVFPSQIQGVTIRDMIQTDASINPGNSGGPLLDSRGWLIGMNTAIISRSGSSAGIGFAVPSNTIRRVVNSILQYGKVIQPSIGVNLLPPMASEQLGLEGVIISEVLSDSPARKSGLRGTKRLQDGNIRLGDVLTAVDKAEIKSYDDIYNALEKHKVGDEVEITYIRISENGKRLTKKTRVKLYNPDK